MSDLEDYRAQLLIVEARLAKDPTNDGLLTMKQGLLEIIELSSELEEENKANKQDKEASEVAEDAQAHDKQPVIKHDDNNPESSTSKTPKSDNDTKDKAIDAQKIAKKKEMTRKKKAKSREKLKEKLELAEQEKQTWQSFASKGLKGMTKKSIFASPCGATGKVGVGTNGIADVARRC